MKFKFLSVSLLSSVIAIGCSSNENQPPQQTQAPVQYVQPASQNQPIIIQQESSSGLDGSDVAAAAVGAAAGYALANNSNRSTYHDSNYNRNYNYSTNYKRPVSQPKKVVIVQKKVVNIYKTSRPSSSFKSSSRSSSRRR